MSAEEIEGSVNRESSLMSDSRIVGGSSNRQWRASVLILSINGASFSLCFRTPLSISLISLIIRMSFVSSWSSLSLLRFSTSLHTRSTRFLLASVLPLPGVFTLQYLHMLLGVGLVDWEGEVSKLHSMQIVFRGVREE